MNGKRSPDESERLLGVATLMGQAQRIVEESGNPDSFDPATWTAKWLESPLPALGGKAPGEFLDTADGRELVSQLLLRQQSGAYF